MGPPPTPPDVPDVADVTVVVVTWQRRELVMAALASLARQTVPCQVLVVDNASDDGTVEAVSEGFPSAEILSLPVNLGFAGGVSTALEQVQTRFVALLNNDAEAEPDWLEISLRRFADPNVAAVTAKLLLMRPGVPDAGPADSGARGDASGAVVNNAGVLLLRNGYGADRALGDADDERVAQPVEVFGFSGGAAVLRTLAVKAVGGFPAGWFMYYEDTDVSWRLRLAGWTVVYEPAAVVHHTHAASSDPASAAFAFNNERNRMLTLARNAPLPVFVLAVGRFVVTTASLSGKRLVGRTVPTNQVFRPALRMRVLVDVVRMSPAELGRRGDIGGRGRRGEVWRAWAGVPTRDLPSGTG